MGNKMLIDATHPEETRVVVLRGNRVEEFDYESAARKQLRGNIYLAKVTRVEPSLQAAFVDYGGNRHGFLAFSEIHPDYYQIPVAEREALLEEQAQGRARRAARQAAEAKAAAASGEEEEFAPGEESHDDDGLAAGLSDTEDGGRSTLERGREHDDDDDHHDVLDAPRDSLHDGLDEIETVGGAAPALPDDGPEGEHDEQEQDKGQDEAQDSEPPHMIALEAILPPRISEQLSAAIARAAEAADEIPMEGDEEAADFATGGLGEEADAPHAAPGEDDDHGGDENGGSNGGGNGEGNGFESVGSEDALEELPQRSKPRRRYKIQEVIRRRQILLVQVVKEERGNKGAALTTYLSLAGRYTVLMPNTDTGGGISRKITQPVDRKRLKEIASELEVPEGMGLIIRTAGAARTKAEIKRDFEYLLRLWENVRDLTLKSTAPALVYEEGNIIKRAIRDLYNKDIDEILVAGDDSYREAKDFMRMLMPSHAKHVQPYREPEPIFIRYEVERQLNAMFSPYVTLRSGGYVVINQTEALVAIDVNSGKATREHSIEDTALRTNTEAAEEIARQLRLRDLAGLIVIDFIDMEEKRNNRSVERRLKDCLRNDRARIQVGHISHFGLLEMSRQRLRTGVLEGSTSQCQMCQGTGVVRSTESVALWVLRTLEDTLRTDGAACLSATTAVEVALYILNHKRNYLRDIETRYGVSLAIMASERMHGANFHIEQTSGPYVETPPAKVVQMDWAQMEAEEEEDAAEAEAEAGSDEEEEICGEEETAGERVSRRRRRRRRNREPRFEGRGRREAGIQEISLQNGRAEPPTLSRRESVELSETGEAAAFAENGRAEAMLATAEASNGVGEFGGEQQLGGGDSSERPKRSRRRGRRGGRRQRSLRQMHEAVAARMEEGEAAEGAAQPETPALEAAPEPGWLTEAAGEAKAQPEAEAKAQPEAEAKAQPEAEAKAQPEAEAKAQPEAEAKAQPEAGAESQPAAPAPLPEAPAPEREPAQAPTLDFAHAAPAETIAGGETEPRTALTIVETPDFGGQPSMAWPAPEAQPLSQPLTQAAEQSDAASPAARAERLRRRRKGWWQRRSNG
jgi:ribonuclease E